MARSCRFRRQFAGALAAVWSLGAAAADNGLYVGVSAAQTRTDLTSNINRFFDVDNNGYKIFAGTRVFDWIGVEGGYVNLGEATQQQNLPDFANFRVKHTGVDAFAVAFLEFATVDLFAKAGAIRWQARISGSSLAGRVDQRESGTDLAWGAGFQSRLGSLAARIEFERFETSGTSALVGTPQMVSIGVSWTFF